MVDVNIKVDLRGFNKAFKEYMEFNKRALPEIVNTKAYFIARNALGTTKAADKEHIREQLEAPSRNYPNAPLAAIIVNAQRQATGKNARGRKGLYGERMRRAIDRLIRIRQSHVNFVRAGWKTAMKQLAPYVRSKAGQAQIPLGIKERPMLGGSKHAPESSWLPKASIWNSARDKTGKGTEKIQTIIIEGLQEAVNKEVRSMKQYIERKLNEGIKRFNRA